MTSKNKYLIVLLVFLILAIISSGLYFSIKKMRNTNQISLIPDIKKEEINQEKVVDLYNQGKFSELNQILDSQLSNNGSDVTLLLQKANTLAQEASLTFKEKELGDQARNFAQKALDLDPNNVQALTLIGYTYEIQEDYVNAHKYYDMALKIEPNNADTLAQKGHAYDLEGKIDETGKFYKQAYNLNKVNLSIVSKLARYYTFTGKHKDAIDLYQTVVSESKNITMKAEAYYSLAGIYQFQKENKKAIEYADLSIRTDPNYPQPKVLLASLLMLSADNSNLEKILKQSIGLIQDAIKISPNLSLAHLELGKILFAIGRKEDAKKIFSNMNEMIDKDITLDKNSKLELKNRVEILLKQK